jgi:membrane protein implicated in regulation of membrane protease activity
MSPAPAFVGGLPGGMELAVLFLILVSFGVVAVVVVAIGRAAFGATDGAGDQRVSDLEDRVANLEGQVAALREDRRERDDGDADR